MLFATISSVVITLYPIKPQSISMSGPEKIFSVTFI
jgi:hypothetical protein